MCYHNTNGFAADDVANSKTKKNSQHTNIPHNIYYQRFISNAYILDWQIGHVGIIDGTLLGNFGIGICGAAAIGKLGALTIQILVTHVKSDLALMCSQFFLCRPILYLCKLHLFPCLRAHTCNYITMMRVGNRGEPRILVKMLLVKIASLSLSGDWKIWVPQGQGSL